MKFTREPYGEFTFSGIVALFLLVVVTAALVTSGVMYYVERSAQAAHERKLVELRERAMLGLPEPATRIEIQQKNEK